MTFQTEKESQNKAQDSADTIMSLLQQGQHEAAKKTALKLVSEFPDDADIAYALAVCQRLENDFSAALETLARVKTIRPDFGRAYQEEGHIYFARGDNDSAIDAYRKALTHNNSLVASLRTLAGLLGKRGDEDEARAALAAFQKLSALPPELLGVRNMMAESRFLKAENLCRHFMQRNPTHVEGMRLLADLGVKTNVLDDAEFILESAVEFEPDNNLARFDYMNVLYRRQKYAQALEQASVLLEKEPENLDYKIGFANQSVAVGDYEPALKIYEDALDVVQNRSDLHLVYGHALKTIGRTDDAIAAYRQTYKVRPDFGDAYWSLANLKTYRFTDAEVKDMAQKQNTLEVSVEDRAHFNFALGKHYEDAKDFEQAFTYYKQGNDLRQSQLQYTPSLMTQRFDAQKQICTKDLFKAKSDMGHDAPDPIFIVGLPRAGSTLLEQILASHSQIEGTLELPNIAAAAYNLGGRRKLNEEPKYPACLEDMPAEDLAVLGKAFIDDTRVHRESAPFFIDKMPNNFRHIGLIKLILPNAKIIDARRHPMACCFSGFKQLFASGQEFTYGLEEIGTYYRDYVDLMDHWDKALPGQILRVQYEDVVADTETQVRRILDYLGLPFEEACLEFHKTKRSVRTASSEQVRQPIFKSGLEQWRNFEPWLDPLKEALGPVLGRYPIT
ncbi:MAG: sulfotransferase [Maricaulaceae bacterium]